MKPDLSIKIAGKELNDRLHEGCGNCFIHNGCLHTTHAYEAPSCWGPESSKEILMREPLRRKGLLIQYVTIHSTHPPVHP